MYINSCLCLHLSHACGQSCTCDISCDTCMHCCEIFTRFFLRFLCYMCCVFGISSRLVKTKGKVCVLNESIFCELLPTHPSMCKRLHVACTALLLQLQRILTWIVRWLHMWALLTPDGPLMESLTLSTHIHRDRTLTMV